MFDTILIPTDGSSDAKKGAETGIELAKALGADVHALYVIQEGTNPWSRDSLEDQMDEARAYGENLTAEVADMAADAGVDCVTDTKVGANVAKQIDEYVQEEGIDAVVMGSGFRGAMGGLIGSTADKVLRLVDVPVTVVRREE